MEVSSTYLCRLCFEEGNINIFDENGRTLGISAAIEQHLGCEVHEDDLFPKCVCSICWSQVRSFHGFYELVRNKQTSFLSRLIKHEDTQRINEQIVNNLTINDDVFHANEMFSVKCESNESHTAALAFRGILNSSTNVHSEMKIEQIVLDTQSESRIREREETSSESRNGKVNRIRARPRKIVVLVNGDTNYKPNDYEVSEERNVGQPRKNTSVDQSISTETQPEQIVKTKRGRGKSKTNNDSDNYTKKPKRPRGDIAKERSLYSLSKDYEDFMLENFKMSCDLCAVENFKSFFEAKTHYMEAHQINHGYIKCCDKKFIYISLVKDHIDNHLNPEMHRCKICNKHSTSKIFLQRHMKKHAEGSTFICDICGHQTNRKSNIKAHIYSIHVPKNPDIKCQYCDKIFSVKFLLERHIGFIHTKEFKISFTTCEICGKSFNTGQMRLHRLKHMDKKERLKNRVQCNICGKLFLSSTELYYHKQLHNKKPIKCDHCQREFQNKTKMLEHIRRSHRESKHKCSLCSRSYHVPSLLKIHMESHTRDREYRCTFCPKVFQVKKSRDTHYSRHHRDEIEKSKQLKKIMDRTDAQS